MITDGPLNPPKIPAIVKEINIRKNIAYPSISAIRVRVLFLNLKKPNPNFLLQLIVLITAENMLDDSFLILLVEIF